MGAQAKTSWDDLSPFTQGYIEALFQTPNLSKRVFLHEQNACDWVRCGFSDLAPETLARIIAGCEEGVDLPFMLGRAYNANDAGGRCFRADRQSGNTPAFPPLTVQLGDDGKVRFSEGEA